ncbi:MAG: DNA-binding response regulator [Thiobacillus sp. 63-78]|uniref:response regulator FixJ n=1 Tax=Thiobacillus sp. 63-78 TaxID=1895859 RepID=UPI00086E14CC|nr:response regulator FixJ [Thiobacillus sp. 63-78]MBN8763665.1 response regulator transcription factor [Thiobacillus sp.]ODU86442.1 MAG: DNA-binding response regulator [Thiobacillus sp. SCN 65-179]MBN8765595.1 response regulator transcription factor [Thiobacillus sp.]MBN8773109.1 response regulator transcription factor [Thiobacillus sp.]OJZ05807.1 MAG: DNA-binding response regulator [Thiobacillus sp. 63-78]
MKERQTVFVVDDDEAARESLRWLLESVGHHVNCPASAREFLESYDGSEPGCLVLDVRMPGMSGLELQNHLIERGWCLPVIVVTGHGDVPMAVRAMKAGAIDFLQKPYNDQTLLDRIQQALELCSQRRQNRSELALIRANHDHLTQREREVAERVVAGKANKVIAIELGLSPKTIEVYRANVMFKMQAHSLSELVQMWMRLHVEAGELS